MTTVTSDSASVGINIGNQWGSGFMAGVTITAEQALNGWTLTFEFDGDINSIWNAQILSKVGNVYTIQSMAYNGNLAAGSSASFGFVASGSPDNITPLSINGDSFGDDGSDVAVFLGNRDDYVVTQIDDTTIEVSGPEGVQTFIDVQTFEFADITQTAAEVVLPRLANVAAGAITVDDTVLGPDDTTTLTALITSDGVIDAADQDVTLVIASQPNAASINGSLGTVVVSGLTTGDDAAVSFDIDAATLAAGTYWVAVQADSSDALTEADEADNLTDWIEITVEPPIADLQLISATLGDRTDLDLTDRGAIEVDYSIENVSNYPASYFQVRSYLSTDAILSDDDTTVGGVTGGTTPGRAINTSSIYYLSEDLAGGDYYLISEVWWGGDVVDATPIDNTIVQTITITPTTNLPVDLAVTDVVLLDNSTLDIADAAQIELQVDVENFGYDFSASGDLSVYLSTDATISDDDVLLTETAMTVYSTGLTLNLDATLDAGISIGDYNLIVVATADGDADISNNIASIPVTLIDTSPSYTGTLGDDIWTGTALATEVDLLDGDDTAIWAGAADQVDGGAGFDTLDFSQLSFGIDASWSNGQFNVFEMGTYQGEAIWTNFEQLIGTDHADHIILDGATGIHNIDAGAGDDGVFGSAGDDTIDLGEGADFYVNSAGDDFVFTGAGADIVGIESVAYDGEKGHDVVADLDILLDTVVFAIDYDETYDPAVDVSQTSDGALFSYGDASSMLFLGVDADDLRDVITIYEAWAYTS